MPEQSYTSTLRFFVHVVLGLVALCLVKVFLIQVPGPPVSDTGDEPLAETSHGPMIVLAAHDLSEPSVEATKRVRPVALTVPRRVSLLAEWGRLGVSDSLKKDQLAELIADSAHRALFYTPIQEEDDKETRLAKRFPSANECARCHPDHFREWSVSQHAYAQMSPIFNAMHGKILKLTNGTNGDFCIRCHTPVGMNAPETEFKSNIQRFAASREGITCIVCHRVKNAYGKVSGRLAIVEGSLFDPVYGTDGGEILEETIENTPAINTDESRSVGLNVHAEAFEFDQISTSAFCGACHDVNLVNGFRLEEAFSEYKSSPASGEGISCQDCHMGKEPGVVSGYHEGPAAVVANQPTPARKRTDHMFAGPDYSIVHPGIFPHNADAAELASIPEWLMFKVEEGWGTDEFEDNIPEGYAFPESWQYADDRYAARDILDDNMALLDTIAVQRKRVLQAGYLLGDIDVQRVSDRGIAFRVEVRNGTNGHNVPTGFDAERLVFLQVTVTDGDGNVVFVSGDRDPNGDIRDSHSIYVHNGELPLDPYLFSLQSRFLTRMVRGGEREQVLAVNYSPSPLPFLRPSTRSTVLLGRPVGARKHRQTIPPLSSKWGEYKVDRSALRGTSGPYRANVKLIAQMVPINLIHEIQDVGFDFYMSPREVAERVVEGAQVLWERDVELE